MGGHLQKKDTAVWGWGSPEGGHPALYWPSPWHMLRRAANSETIEICEICAGAYWQVDAVPPPAVRSKTSSCLADTSAQMCLAGLGVLARLGLVSSDLLTPSVQESVANNVGLQMLGVAFVTFTFPRWRVATWVWSRRSSPSWGCFGTCKYEERDGGLLQLHIP